MATCRECIHYKVCLIKTNVLCKIDKYTYEEYHNIPNVENFCENFVPKSDYVKRERGEWIKINEICGVEFLECSVCKGVHPRMATNFCCDCGADMRKEDNNG